MAHRFGTDRRDDESQRGKAERRVSDVYTRIYAGFVCKLHGLVCVQCGCILSVVSLSFAFQGEHSVLRGNVCGRF